MIGLVDRTRILVDVRQAWRMDWEVSPEVASCRHDEFEAVRLLRGGLPDEIVVRCVSCNAPRCGSSGDSDPCMRIRHHGDDQPSLLRDEHLPYSKSIFLPDLADVTAVEKWLDAP